MIFSSCNTPTAFYVYAYLREDSTPYYVGKGTGKRAWTKGKGEVYPPKDKSKIQLLQEDLTEEDAFILERELILKYGRIDIGTGILRNKSDGGEGPAGAKRSAETIDKLRKSHLGKKFTEEHRKNLSISHSKKKLTDTHKEKIKESTIKRFENIAERQKVARKGSDNNNASIWEITDPSGNTITVTSLNTWCKENNIPRDRIRFSQCGWQGKNLGKKNKLKKE